MSDEKNSMLFLTFGLLHDLVRETDALHHTVERELLLDENSKRGDAPYGSPHPEANSFYRDLEWRISKGQLSPEQTTHALNLILREVNFFRVMVHNYCGAIMRHQQLVLNKKRVKLESLIEEIIDLFMFSAADKGVDIITRVASTAIFFIDRELVYRVLVNVIDNAIKYSYSSVESSIRRHITVEARRHSVQGDWVISVASYGVGITEEEISSGYIFEYGNRGMRAADRGRGGTGIGLAEAKRIVEAHKGKIQVTSREMTTEAYLTTVKIILPGGQST